MFCSVLCSSEVITMYNDEFCLKALSTFGIHMALKVKKIVSEYPSVSLLATNEFTDRKTEAMSG